MKLARRLAENLKKRRGKTSISAFARQLKLSKSALHRLENAESNPTTATLEKLMKALKCDISNLFN